MTSTDLVRRLHQHRAWVNGNLLAAAEPLTDAQLRRPFDIGQGSIWKSLTHLYAAEWVWMETLLGEESPTLPGDVPGQLPGNQSGPGAIASFAELKEKWLANEARWQKYLAALTDGRLDEVIYKVSTSSGAGKRWPSRRSDVLLHVCTHAQYTTAQVVNMLRHSGVAKLPEVMLISLVRQEAAR